jgi:hypothetical protein
MSAATVNPFSRYHLVRVHWRTRTRDRPLTKLLIAIAKLDLDTVADLLNANTSLATAALSRGDEFFLVERLTQMYAGDTAFHAATVGNPASPSRQPARQRDIID